MPRGKMAAMATLALHQFQALHVGPLDLTVGAGECVCIRGASGSGKSLLLRAIADLDPHQGEAWLDGRRCSAMPAPSWRRQVALLAAEAQWWSDTIGAHFSTGCKPVWLDRLGLPPTALDWEAARCSTGERQRLALLRTLMQGPAALLLDEPTGNLDEDSTARVESLLDDYRRSTGAALLWISHDPRQASRVAQRCFLLVDGRLTAECTTTAEPARS
ncbi:ABC transporter [Thauera sp. 27]|nr:ABC transporter [Thauera sp. 27]